MFFFRGQTRRADPGRAGQMCELRRLGVSSRNALGFAALVRTDLRGEPAQSWIVVRTLVDRSTIDQIDLCIY
jgi:hypothetical protein